MGERLVETLIGVVVLIVAGAFFVYAYTRSTVRTTEGYDLRAHFGSVGGLAVGSDVRISGIKVGTVTREELDSKTYVAIVHMNVASHIRIPDDSAVRIAQEGLLGGNYLSIEPGGSDDMLKPGGEIAYTQGSVDLMSLVGQAIFSARGGGGGGSGNGAPSAGGSQGGGFGAPSGSESEGRSGSSGAAAGSGVWPSLEDAPKANNRPGQAAPAQPEQPAIQKDGVAPPPIQGGAPAGQTAAPTLGGDTRQVPPQDGQAAPPPANPGTEAAPAH